MELPPVLSRPADAVKASASSGDKGSILWIMRIYVLNYEFPPVGGGGGRAAEDICKALVRRGHSVKVQTSHVRGLPRVEKRDGYTIYRTFSFRRRQDRCSVTEMAAYAVLSCVPVLREALTWKPDVMHVHFAVPTGVLGLMAHLVTGVPYVLTVHLGDVPGGVPEQTDHLFRFIKPATNLIWRSAAAVTAVSEYTRSLALNAYDVPVKIIPNGVVLGNCLDKPLRVHSPVRLLFVGRLNPQKNLPFFLDVLNKVKDLSWRLDVLGDGPLKDKLDSTVKSEALTDRIQLHGWVDSSIIDRFMRESDILILPSLSEGMSVVSVKALEHGLAILGSRVGGLQDVVQEGINGFLCPVNDRDAFEASLRKMVVCVDLLLRMKAESRRIANLFDLERTVTQYEDLFREVAQ